MVAQPCGKLSHSLCADQCFRKLLHIADTPPVHPKVTDCVKVSRDGGKLLLAESKITNKSSTSFWSNGNTMEILHYKMECCGQGEHYHCYLLLGNQNSSINGHR